MSNPQLKYFDGAKMAYNDVAAFCDKLARDMPEHKDNEIAQATSKLLVTTFQQISASCQEKAKMIDEMVTAAFHGKGGSA